jgi:hypothetical protein
MIFTWETNFMNAQVLILQLSIFIHYPFLPTMNQFPHSPGWVNHEVILYSLEATVNGPIDEDRVST